MRNLELTVDGKRMTAESGSRLIGIVGASGPAIAAKVNGRLESLQARITGNATIETVALDSPLGKRVYRKSLCFLLSYASALIAPERVLIIGHSLGDGYYFRYRGNEKPDRDSLMG